MNHVFITRMAVILGGSAKLKRTKHREYDTVNDRLNDIIKYWFNHASKFYTSQTVDHPFVLYIVYSEHYKDVVLSYNWPDWCILTRNKDIDHINDKSIFGAYDNKPLSVSRIDADDWYSNDYFEYLSQDHKLTHNKHFYTTHLHKELYLFDRYHNRISVPVKFSSPGFASITFSKFMTGLLPLNTGLWPHGMIKRRPHYTPEEKYGIQSVGCNVVNKWRPCTKLLQNGADILSSRFYIPTGLDNYV